MRMKKMLIVNDTVTGGGVEKLMYDMIMHWYKEFEITVFTEKKDKDFYNIYPKEVKCMHYTSSRSLKNIRGFRRYEDRFQNWYKERTIKKVNDMDFAILLAMKEGPVSALASKIKAKVKFAWVHLDYVNAYWTKDVFGSAANEVACMKTYRNVICVSEYIKETIIKTIGNPGNLLVRYNPIDEKLICKMAAKKVTDIPEKSDVIRFVSVGRLHYQKGYDMLLTACKKLKDEGYHFEVYIIGWGETDEEFNQLEEQRKQLGLSMVRFMGYRENPYPYLKSADWFISSSRYEGYSLVSQEATILDVPIIATNCSGVSELLGEDGRYGIVADISIEGIHDKMKMVLDDLSLRDRYCELIKERKSIISFDERIDAIRKLFDN